MSFTSHHKHDIIYNKQHDHFRWSDARSVWNKMKAVAIDGPAGAGKSTIAKHIAHRLGFIYVDTGALYRAVAYFVLQHDISMSDVEHLDRALSAMHLDLRFIANEQRVFLNNIDVSDQLRSTTVSMQASQISAMKSVRAFLLALQKDIAQHNNVIMDGRDIGTVILPHADVKIFLTATAEDRAKRRYRQLLQHGTQVDFQQLLTEIQQRDYNDSHRALAPLKQAPDAIVVDTTGNTLEQSIQLLTNIIQQRLC